MNTLIAKKVGHVIRWTVYTVALSWLGALVLFNPTFGVPYVGNLFKFLFWFAFGLQFLALLAHQHLDVTEISKYYIIPQSIDLLFDFCFMAMLCTGGQIGLGMAWIVPTLWDLILHTKIKAERKKQLKREEEEAQRAQRLGQQEPTLQEPQAKPSRSDRKLSEKLEALQKKYDSTVTYARELRTALQVVADADESNSVSALIDRTQKVLRDNPDIT